MKKNLVTTFSDRLRFAKYFGRKAPCFPLSEQKLLDNLSGTSHIVVGKARQTLAHVGLAVMWSGTLSLTLAGSIPLLIVLMIGGDAAPTLAVLIALPLGLMGAWKLGIKGQLEAPYLSWSFEKMFDLATREYVLTATCYDRKHRKYISFKEVFPFDDLQFTLITIEEDTYQQVGIYLRPTDESKKVASKLAFKIQDYIYLGKSYSLHSKETLTDDVKRVAQALEMRTGVKFSNLHKLS